MSGDPSLSMPLEGGLDGLNATVKAALVPETIWETLQDFSFLALELKLVLSALGIIYVGAHAALRRPPSAAPPKSRRNGQKAEKEEHFSQGLELSDAIMFPLMAGIMLVGLYYLIQYLQDPEILNKILRWYLSTMSILSLLTLYTHGFQLVSSFIFPHYWRGRDGKLRQADQKARAVRVCDDVGNVIEAPNTNSSPLPWPLSILAPMDSARKAAWDIRSLAVQQWTFKFYAHGFGDLTTKVQLSHMTAFVAAVGTAIAYTSTMSPFLSNILGYGLCYGTFMLLSPTNLCTGTLVMIGLFFYDIIMVFYTPYMVTVATKLDVPIKLTFEAAERKSILGLGDIVLPGIVMAFALRLDLWLHYQRKVKYEPTELKLIEKDASGALVTRSETKYREIKVPYIDVKNRWADRFWTQSWLSFRPSNAPLELAGSRFNKTYFTASLVGYGLGMGVTLAMLLIFRQGQPALLYLVPGVLGAIYLTALVRGELKLIWGYTEDGTLDTRDVIVDVDGDGRAVKTLGKLENGVVNTTIDISNPTQADTHKDQSEKKSSEKGNEKNEPAKKKGHPVLLISLEAPAEEPAE
ncbi:unnamed protein product [Clonostachys solani]|uniref:Intramembrane protease 2 n=1 Tax=Clonostachys solani TaxID=160281 RepID=A0A9N9VYF7_9HYPO|nr:unnamed protein product [Clonostachys solani]